MHTSPAACRSHTSVVVSSCFLSRECWSASCSILPGPAVRHTRSRRALKCLHLQKHAALCRGDHRLQVVAVPQYYAVLEPAFEIRPGRHASQQQTAVGPKQPRCELRCARSAGRSEIVAPVLTIQGLAGACQYGDLAIVPECHAPVRLLSSAEKGHLHGACRGRRQTMRTVRRRSLHRWRLRLAGGGPSAPAAWKTPIGAAE